VFWVFTFVLFAQTTNDVGKIAISVVMPDTVEGLNASHLSKLQTKIVQIVSASGITADGGYHNFVIYPKFALYGQDAVEGGMQNIAVVSVELSLFIKQVDNNLLFSTICKHLKGSGFSKETAITDAISKIPVRDGDLITFIETGKSKIIQYYEIKCNDIIKKSDSYVNMQQFEQAIGLLMTIPEEVSDCYHRVEEKTIEAYKGYQTQKCAERMQIAKTTLAANNYDGALQILSEIDPAASCFSESQKVAKQAELMLDEEQRKQWEFKMKRQKDSQTLEKIRIDAIKEIAIAYYRQQPTKINYNYIIW
jgi:hypothetical protein